VCERESAASAADPCYWLAVVVAVAARLSPRVATSSCSMPRARASRRATTAPPRTSYVAVAAAAAATRSFSPGLCDCARLRESCAIVQQLVRAESTPCSSPSQSLIASCRT